MINDNVLFFCMGWKRQELMKDTTERWEYMILSCKFFRNHHFCFVAGNVGM